MEIQPKVARLVGHSRRFLPQDSSIPLLPRLIPARKKRFGYNMVLQAQNEIKCSREDDSANDEEPEPVSGDAKSTTTITKIRIANLLLHHLPMRPPKRQGHLLETNPLPTFPVPELSNDAGDPPACGS